MYKKMWCLCRDVVCQSKTYSIGQFRVPPGLCIKTRLRAQPLIWKWFFILMQIKLIFTRKLVELASFWKWGFFGTRKWPIAFLPFSLTSPSSLLKLPIIPIPTVICSPANMFFLHFWPLQFYSWLNAVTTVSAFGLKFKEFAWCLPRFSLKVLLPEVYLNIFTATEGFQVILPVTEDSQSKSRTMFSLSPNHWLGNLELSKSRLRKFWTKQKKEENVDDSVSTCCVLWLAI